MLTDLRLDLYFVSTSYATREPEGTRLWEHCFNFCFFFFPFRWFSGHAATSNRPLSGGVGVENGFHATLKHSIALTSHQ